MFEEQLTTKGERTRQTLIDVAFELFVEKGYSATSMRHIAQRAGLALGGIYNHFSNKEEIFTAVILYHHPFVSAFPALADSEGESAAELIRHAAHLVVAAVEAQPRLFNLIFIELIELNGRHMPKLAAALFPYIAPFLDQVTSHTAELRHTNPLTFIRSFAGLVLGYLVTQQLFAHNPLPVSDPTTLDDLVDIYLHGLLQPPEGFHVSQG